MKKAVSFLIAIQLTALLAAPAFAIDTIRSNYDAFSVTSTSIQNDSVTFTDVQPNAWYYNDVMKANELGLLKGKPNNRYDPEGQLTCAEFITIAVRAIGKEAEAQGYSGAGDHWSYGYYRVAQKYGLIKSGEFGDANRDRAMTREEMAYISMNVLKHNNEYPEKTMPLNNIPDIAKVKDDYNIGAVQFCYSMGVLVGVDTQGNYNPQGVLKRNAGATVAVRLVDASARKTPNFDAKPQQQQQTPQGQQTSQGQQSFTEGSQHNIPQVGDKVTTKDGQTYTIEMKYGVLGANVNADIWTNAMDNGYPCKVGKASPNDMTPLVKDDRTGQVHSASEWKLIRNQSYPTGYTGDYDGEIFNDWWKWDAEDARWSWIGGKY